MSLLLLSFQTDKVQFIQNIKELSRKEARNAEMALFCGQEADGEAILLQSGLIFRAIIINIQLYNWNRSVASCVCVCVCLSQIVIAVRE